MQRKRSFPAILGVGLVLVVALASCGSNNGPQPSTVPPTKTPRPTFTPTSAVTPTRLVISTPTTAPTVAPTKAPATATTAPEAVAPTATAQPASPQFTASQTVNVRGGPGTGYATLGQLKPGDNYKLIGKNGDGSWLQFNFEGDPAWVNAGLVTVIGDLNSVKVAQNIPQAPAPAPVVQPAPQPAPAQPTAVPQPPKPQFPFQLVNTVSCQVNKGSTYFDGFVRYRNNSPRNGVCVHIAYYGPRNTKCSGCDGEGDGRFSFSPFGGPAPKGTQVEIYVVSCPAGGMPKGGQSQQTGFSDLTPQSEKWVHTVNESEECHGVTFVGD